jgi:exosome complex RNA-binding protein Rrp4
LNCLWNQFTHYFLMESKIVVPGDLLGEGFVAGHGTFLSQQDQKSIYASIAGVVHL